MDNSRAIICDAYLVLLGRQPWETEITYWRDFFRAGGSMAGLYEEILSSHEGQLMQKRLQQAPGGGAVAVYELRSQRRG